MRGNVKEFITINMILVMVLILLAVFSFAEDKTLSAFTNSSAAIYKVDTEEKVVAFMVNVYWGTEYIEPFLALFEKEGVKVTFFLGGIWAKENGDLVKKMAAKGHEIGNHGYNHKLPSRISRDEIRREIAYTDTIITETIGKKPTLYAPPAGDYNKDTLNIAASLGYYTIMWSIDTIDWRDKDAAKIKGRIMNNLKPGAFVLMHPTADTYKALQEVIPAIKQQGYRFLTVKEMLELK